MHTEVLSSAQGVVLDTLRPILQDRPFYLAGGTALALRHGHRRSIDFDFFSASRFDVNELVATLADAFDEFEQDVANESNLVGKLLGVSASFFYYKYPLIKEPEPTVWGFSLGSDEDLAAMKIEAITGRGSIKDFTDLFYLCRSGMKLETAFEFFDQKYGLARTERYHRLRALTYFEDADEEDMPDMLVPFDWEEAKQFFRDEAVRLIEEFTSEN